MIAIPLLLSLLPKALKLIPGLSPNARAVVNEAADIVEQRKDDPEVQKALASIDLEELKVDASVVAEQEETSRAMIASNDPYTQRARPTGLYVSYALTTLVILTQCALALLAKPLMNATEIISMLVPLSGGSAWYQHLRTKEKLG